MRLQKYMALCGVASRRKSEKIIAEGRVSVNGKVVDFAGCQVDEHDVVTVDGRKITPEKHEYILLNKPAGIVSTSEDAHAPKKILDLVQSKNRLYSVGRLDKETEGLLILTNDGDLTFRLTHPSHEFVKTYECTVKGHLSGEDLARLRGGVVIETEKGSYKTRPAGVEILNSKRGSTRLLVQIAEGKKRQIRKMLQAVGHPVTALRRTAIGRLRGDNLKPGEWRHLTDEEIAYLKQQ